MFFADVATEHDDVADEDERRRENRPSLILHDHRVTLELPDLIGDHLHFAKRVAERRKKYIE